MRTRIYAWMALAVLTAGCSPSPQQLNHRDALAEQTSGSANKPPAPPSPPPPPGSSGPQPTSGNLAAREVADTSGFDQAQIDAMFDAAVEQKRPFPEHTAICVGLRGRQNRQMHDAPAPVIQRLANQLGLPAFPASQCAMDGFKDGLPAVAATGEKVMYYSVVIEPATAKNEIIFWAHATFGNLGSEGAKFSLRRRSGQWVPVFMNVRVLS